MSDAPAEQPITEQPKTKRRRSRIRWYHKLFALLVPLLLVALVAEVGLRLFGKDVEHVADDMLLVPSDDPVLIYGYRPNHTVTHGGIEYATNPQGFRDDPFGPKADGAYRIAVVGDSLVFGYAEPLEQAFPQQLERALGPPVEVLNLGVAGYNSIQEVRLVETQALPLKPDLLVLPYVHNDNKEDGGDGGVSLYFKRTPSRFYDWLGVRTRRLARKMGRDVTTEAYDTLAALAKQHDLPVVVVIFPELRFRDEKWSHPERHAEVRRLAEERGFLVLDLLEPFVQAGYKDFYHDNIHPKAEGYALAVRELQAFLKAEGLLPPAKK